MQKEKLGKPLYWLTNHHTYYHDYLFQHLEIDGDFSLKVCYRKFVLETHPWREVDSVNYEVMEMSRFPVGLDLRLVWKAMVGREYFVIAGWDCFMYILMITILRLRNRQFGVFSDTPKRPGISWKQQFKLLWLKYVFGKNSNGKLLVTGNIGVKRSLDYLGIHPERLQNFPFATNHEVFSPLHAALSSIEFQPVVFLAVGRIDFCHKGQDIALQALAGLLKRGVNRFRYRVAGIGDDMLRMKDKVSELGLTDYVELLGWIEIRDLPSIFCNAHFTLHTSHEDPFPNSVLESLSCGVPVISSTGAGSALDRIQTGINGYVFQDGDVEALQNILLKVFSLTDTDWIQMKERSRKGALEWPVQYNIDIINKLFA